MADCWRDGDNVALGAEIMMLPIDNFFWTAALWPDRVAFEIADADRCQQISYAALADMTRSMAAGLQAIELHDGANTSATEIIKFVKQQLDSVKAPKAVLITQSLTRCPVGKVLRRAAKQLFA